MPACPRILRLRAGIESSERCGPPYSPSPPMGDSPAQLYANYGARVGRRLSVPIVSSRISLVVLLEYLEEVSGALARTMAQ
jgi:hypothetical protein